MSERQAKKTRYNLKLEYIALFELWLAAEPPIYRIFKWKKWKNSRPTLKF